MKDITYISNSLYFNSNNKERRVQKKLFNIFEFSFMIHVYSIEER